MHKEIVVTIYPNNILVNYTARGSKAKLAL